MSDQPSDNSLDWRRRPRRERASREVAASEADSESAAAPEEELVTSRTLFSYLEPVVDTIGSFGTPMVIAGIVGLVVGITLAAFVSSLRLYGFITIGFSVVLLGLVTLIFLSSVFAAFISRTGRYGVNSLVMLAAFLGIVVVINFIAFGNITRVDTTATNQFSLAQRTRDLLDNLNQPVKATGFFVVDLPASVQAEVQRDLLVRQVKVEEKLREFENRSSKFSYEIKDPDLEPELARSLGVTQNESIVIEGLESGIADVVLPTDQFYTELEQDLYTSILVATGQGQKTVYFLTGHGERSIHGTGGDGYDSIRQGLEGDNYQVQTLRWDPLDTEVTVPDGSCPAGEEIGEDGRCPSGVFPLANADLLVIARPTGELPDAHAEALNSYLAGRNPDGSGRREGGRMIFLAEPDTDESFLALLANWGVVVDRGYIRDLDGSVPGNPHTLRLERYNNSPLVSDISYPRGTPLQVAFMPGAAPIRFLAEEERVRIPIPLAVTTPNSYLIDDIERTDPVTEGDTADPQASFSPAVYVRGFGPVGAAAPTAQPPENETSGLVVFGDSDFIANSFADRGSGAALFLNSANFLLGDISLVSIRDRAFVRREINLDRNQYNFVRFSSWFFLPGLMGLMAALVWWVRR